MPGPFEPMKATLTDRPFSDPAWIFERKLDGVRALAFRDGGEARLYSRTRKAMRGYPEVAESLEADACTRFVVDGEPVATGVVVIGDAAMTTNPWYGKGCAQAGIAAEALSAALREHGRDGVGVALAMDAAMRRPERMPGTAPGRMILATMAAGDSAKLRPMRTRDRSTLSTAP